MTSLLNRSNLWETTLPLTQAINSLLEQSFVSPTWGSPATNLGLALDVYEDTDNYYILGVLPGVDPGQVNIVAQENTLTVSGEIPNFVPEGKHVVWHELPAGKFTRSITLPMPFDVDKAQAQYDQGLLKLVVPKAEYARPRRIEIGKGQAQLAESAGNGKSNTR